MKISLKLKITGKGKYLRIPIDRLPFLIGRDPVCHLRPASHFVSKHHCAIWTRGDHLLVRDLGSTNGTYLNDRAVMGEQQAVHGDRLKIGPLVFDVCFEGPPAVALPISLPPGQSSAQTAATGEDAAFLLLLGEDASAAATRPVELDPVPSGKTVLLSASALQTTGSQADPGQSTQPAASALSDTATVADAILQKYLRRPRS